MTNAIIYIIQNENHAINFLHTDKQYYPYIYLCLDKYTGLNTQSLFPKEEKRLIIVENKFKTTFQNTNLINKLSMINYITKKTKTLLSSCFDNSSNVKIIIGNDGALQKSIISASKSIFPRLRVELWIDTIMGERPKTVKTSILSSLEPFLARHNISQYFPSILATSSLVNHIFVAHNSNRLALSRRGVPLKRITVHESPRISQLKQKNEIHKIPKKPRVLYVASAWAWHGRADVEEWQTRIIKELINIAEKSDKSPSTFSIRLHPRQDSRIALQFNKKYISHNVSFEDDILDSTIVVSFRSSALYDATLIGKDTYIYEKGAPETPRNTFIDSIKRIHNLDDILYINIEPPK